MVRIVPAPYPESVFRVYRDQFRGNREQHGEGIDLRQLVEYLRRSGTPFKVGDDAWNPDVLLTIGPLTRLQTKRIRTDWAPLVDQTIPDTQPAPLEGFLPAQ
jgi:hypothetical protein